jgi:hypothetical protein
VQLLQSSLLLLRSLFCQQHQRQQQSCALWCAGGFYMRFAAILAQQSLLLDLQLHKADMPQLLQLSYCAGMR